jgi:hypothetical protein
MKAYRCLHISLLFLLLCTPAFSGVYFNAATELHSRYIFRGTSPAGARPALSLSASAYFTAPRIGITQLYLNSLPDLSAYREAVTTVNYYHYFNDNISASAGVNAYFYPGVADTPPLTAEFDLRFSYSGDPFPASAESYFDIVRKSWYWKFSAAHTFDLFLPLQIGANAGVNALSYSRFGQRIPRGFSDISASLSTYISLKNWQFTPKLSYIVSLNKTMPRSMWVRACLYVAYSF